MSYSTPAISHNSFISVKYIGGWALKYSISADSLFSVSGSKKKRD
jgi:hypothetical protein